MAFLKNTWYCAALADELTHALLTRTIAGVPILMYRKEDGTPVAMSNVCPHRFAPLDMGRLVGDEVECHYHGLRFDPSGACVHNPFGAGVIPQKARVATFPLVEQEGLIWVWPGEAGRADLAAVPSFPHRTEPGFKALDGVVHMAANYQLAADNLLDPSHSQFVHGDYLATDMLTASKYEMVHEGDRVESNYWSPQQKGPPHFMRNFPDPNILVDHWTRVRWNPPCTCVVDVGVIPHGRPETEGIRQIAIHLITPETETSSFYFYGHSRNYQLDNPEADARTREWQQVGVAKQDVAVMEAVQRHMPDTDLFAGNPVLLKQDVAAIQARRVLAKLIADEQTSQRRRGAAAPRKPRRMAEGARARRVSR